MKEFMSAFGKDPDVKGLPRCEYYVFRALCFLAGKDTGDCFPHHKTVAAKAHYSIPSVRRAIANLKIWKYIYVQTEYLLTPKGTKLYIRNRHFFKKWAELNQENGLWNNGIQEWDEHISEIPIRGHICEVAPEADSQGGGVIKMIRGVYSKLSEGCDQNDHLSKVILSKGNNQVERENKNSLSLQPNGADAPQERENNGHRDGGTNFVRGEVTKERRSLACTAQSEGNDQRPATKGNGASAPIILTPERKKSFVTFSEVSVRRLPRAPSATRGGFSGHSATQCRICGKKHPAGMPSLEQIRAEIRKWRPRKDGETPEEIDEEVKVDALDLHDRWASSGFRHNNGRPIADWEASLRGWLRRREK